MQNIEAHLKNIISANNSNNLAIFVGAGVSKSSNNETLKLPSWSELIDTLKLDLKIKDESDYTKLAQLYFLEFSEIIYYKKIKDFFPDYIEPSNIHRLIFEIRPQCIITTNWDNILERTVENEGLSYETICSDKDLVKCANTKKIIKMHGDFKNHNIVFKEDDYLNYSHNFPLIENYIKSILSTHTIMFLGYSYSDINLKHIMRWIQNHSAYCPPMYLITFDSSDSQKKYLENHGITTLILEECKKPSKEDPKTIALGEFLSNIQNNISNRNPRVSADESIAYIYDQIQPLSGFQFIELDDIQSALPCCSFTYIGCNIIIGITKFKPATNDYSSRKSFIAHKKFFLIIKKYEKLNAMEKEKFNNENKKLTKILEIFAKARILGVEISRGDHGKITYFVNEFSSTIENQIEEDREYLNFNSKPMPGSNKEDILTLSSEAYSYYEMENYAESYRITLKIISLCKKQRNYSNLLISIFNRNLLLRMLKSTEFDNEEYSGKNDIDLHDAYSQLPKNQIKLLKNLYKFLSFNHFYEKFYSATISLQERSRKNTIYFNDPIDSTLAKHVNLTFFTLKNKIMIDQYKDYKSLHEKYLNLLALVKTKDNKLSLSVYEIYSIIKFTSKEFVKSFFEDFTSEDSVKRKEIIIEEKDLKWLVNVALPNIVEKLISEHDRDVITNQFINIIYFLSVINLDEYSTDKILNEVSKITSKKYSVARSYEAINIFFAHQFNLYKNQMNSKILLEIIEGVLNKVATGNASAYEIRELTMGGGLRNLYHYTGNLKGIFSNDSLIDMLIMKISKEKTEDRIRLAESVILNIYNISNKSIRAKIKSFVLDINALDARDHVRYKFETWMAAVGFRRPTKKSAESLGRYLEEREAQNSISSDCLSLKNMVDYLVNQKGAIAYTSPQKKLEKAVLKYEQFQSRRF